MKHYGKHIMTTHLDDNGSTLTTTKGYRPVGEYVTNRYEIRVKVRNEKEELEQYLAFQKEKLGKKYPEFKIETSHTGDQEGFYYVVKAWTEP